MCHDLRNSTPQNVLHYSWRNDRCLVGLLMSITFLSFTSLLAQQLTAQSQTTIRAKSSVQSQQSATLLEQKVKVAYLYNFGRYFEWPAKSLSDSTSTFVIGVLGKNSLGSQLEKLAQKKKIKGKKIEIRHFASADKIQSCHLLFVTRTVTDSEFKAAIKKTKSQSVLVVSERTSATSGSSIRLFVDQANTVGFGIDINVVNNKKLQVNAKLLKLARASKTSSSQVGR